MNKIGPKEQALKDLRAKRLEDNERVAKAKAIIEQGKIPRLGTKRPKLGKKA